MKKLNYPKTFLIGFGFFASSLAWSLYNSFVPVLLKERYLESTALIGFIMTIDNIFGVIFQPLVGQISDRTHTRIGKRMPYILVGIPVCALAFFFIPRTGSLFTMMGVIILFNFVMSIWRSPVVSLMPDLTPSIHRSKANGIINLMGGVGGIIAFLAGGYLANVGGDNAPFLMGSLVMLVAVVILFLFVKEPDSRRLSRALDARQALAAGSGKPVKEKKVSVQETLQALDRPQKRSLVALLLAIFFWFCGYNAVEAFFTLYATEHLLVSKGDAAMMLSLFSIALVVFALPSGILAGRLGRKRMILIGLVGLISVFIPMFFVEHLLVLKLLLFAGGLFWACVNINSLPMVVELASDKHIGSFTGYYYFFSFSAAILSPILFGWIRDLTDRYATLFLYAIVSFALALVAMTLVRHGEAKPQPPVPEPGS